MSDRPALEELIKSFLHQDYEEIHGSARGAVATYVRTFPGSAKLVNLEILGLLDEAPDEIQLEAELDKLGLHYNPVFRDWPTHRAWLLDVVAQVDAELRTGNS